MNRTSSTTDAASALREAIPPRSQWNPLVVSGVKRVNSGEDPDAVALEMASRIPGFKRSELGAYTAAFNKGKKKVKEGLFSAPEPDVADRDNKEQAVQALLGSEDVDVKKVPDEKLSGLIQGLGSITTESIDNQVAQIISVMREQKASRNDVLEALQVHIGFNLREAKEVLQEHLTETAPFALRENEGTAYYINHARQLLRGVTDIAGLDPAMAALCFGLWNYWLAKDEEPPTKKLADQWRAGISPVCLSDGRYPGAKEADALPALVEGMNDIIADREENLNIR